MLQVTVVWLLKLVSCVWRMCQVITDSVRFNNLCAFASSFLFLCATTLIYEPFRNLISTVDHKLTPNNSTSKLPWEAEVPKTSPELKGGKGVQMGEVGRIIVERKETLTERKRLELGGKGHISPEGVLGVLRGQRAAVSSSGWREPRYGYRNKYLYISDVWCLRRVELQIQITVPVCLVQTIGLLHITPTMLKLVHAHLSQRRFWPHRKEQRVVNLLTPSVQSHWNYTKCWGQLILCDVHNEGGVWTSAWTFDLQTKIQSDPS